MSNTLTLQSVEQALHKEYKNKIINYFRGNEREALKFMSAVSHSIRKNPKLLECTQQSLLDAFIACAEYGLYPSDVSGEAYVIPYYNNKSKLMEAKFQLGYQGLVTLLYRSPSVSTIQAKIVYEKDNFEYEEGLEPILKHKPTLNKKERGNPIAVYSVAKINGEKVFHIMSSDDIMEFKKFSKSAKYDNSPWDPKKDPELTMWKKTCVKQQAKFLPKSRDSEVIHNAIHMDNDDSNLVKKPENSPKPPQDGEDDPNTTNDDESTEWRDKLASKLMEMANGEANAKDVWAGMETGEDYPETEEHAQTAYATLLKNTNANNNGKSNTNKDS